MLVKGKILNPYERRDHEPVGDRLQHAWELILALKG